MPFRSRPPTKVPKRALSGSFSRSRTASCIRPTMSGLRGSGIAFSRAIAAAQDATSRVAPRERDIEAPHFLMASRSAIHRNLMHNVAETISDYVARCVHAVPRRQIAALVARGRVAGLRAGHRLREVAARSCVAVASKLRALSTFMSTLEVRQSSATSAPDWATRGVGTRFKTASNPMKRRNKAPVLLPLRLAPQCGARTRRGTACKAKAANSKGRCRLHGGAVGSGALSGHRNGNYRHGRRGEAINTCPRQTVAGAARARKQHTWLTSSMFTGDCFICNCRLCAKCTADLDLRT